MAFAFVLALVWGVVWALCLQTYAGRFLAARYTWITVVIGVGGDLLIALLVVPVHVWVQVIGIVGLSSIGIVGRSLWNEHQDQRMLTRMIDGDKDETGE